MILDRYTTHEDYIRNSPEWQNARMVALRRAGYKCQVCSDTKHLDVHHNCYYRLGLEIPEDLCVLCRPCHGWAHEREQSRLKQGAKTLPGGWRPRWTLKDYVDTKLETRWKTGDLDGPAPRSPTEVNAEIVVITNAAIRCMSDGYFCSEFGDTQFWCESNTNGIVLYKLMLEGIVYVGTVPKFKIVKSDKWKFFWFRDHFREKSTELLEAVRSEAAKDPCRGSKETYERDRKQSDRQTIMNDNQS